MNDYNLFKNYTLQELLNELVSSSVSKRPGKGITSER